MVRGRGVLNCQKIGYLGKPTVWKKMDWLLYPWCVIFHLFS